MSWLRDTAEETLQASPFANHCQMFDFLTNLDSKRRVVLISGAPIAQAAGFSNLLTSANLLQLWKRSYSNPPILKFAIEINGQSTQFLNLDRGFRTHFEST